MLTDADPNAIVVSVDGIGAYDLISRSAMMKGVRHLIEGEQILPCGRTTVVKFTSSHREKAGSGGSG